MNDEERSQLEKILKIVEKGLTEEFIQELAELKARDPILYNEFISMLKAAKEEGGVRNDGKN